VSNPLEHAQVGEQYHVIHTRQDGTKANVRLVIVEHEGTPWVCWDYTFLCPLEDYSMWHDAEYVRVIG
jgi:hypothetical protein